MSNKLIIGNLTSQDGAIQLSSGYYESLNLETLHIDIPEIFNVWVNAPMLPFIEQMDVPHTLL